MAERSFKTLIAIAAKFDFELKQYDVINAFVNVKLIKNVYMRMPFSYKKLDIMVKLLKALYGLRESFFL